MPTFTDASIRRLQPRERAYRAFEGGSLAGFGIAISPGGGKSFFVQHTENGIRRFYRIGSYPAMPLSVAREKARELLAQLEQGIDPRAQPAVSGSLELLVQAWLAHQRDNQRRRLADTESMLRNNIPAALLAKPAATILPADIRAVLAAVHQRGARVYANRLRAHLHAIWQYGMRADNDPRRLGDPVLFGLVTNPVAAIPRDAGAESARDRVLSWDEVREVWYSERLSWPARQAIRLLLLTGARVNEIVQASWSEFDFEAGLWTLPVARSKNKRQNITPLCPLMLEMLRELRDIFPDTAWLFPAGNSESATKPWGITALSHAVRRAGYDWQARDLRRTFKTLAAGAGIGRDILDRLQNHSRSDVASRHYDKYSYAQEKLEALLQWESILKAHITGDNVIAFKKRKKAGD